MSRIVWPLLIMVFALSLPAFAQTCPQPQDGDPDDSQHFLFGRPVDLNQDYDTMLVTSFAGQSRAYELMFNKDKKFADWAAYCIDHKITEQVAGRPGRTSFKLDPDVPNDLEIAHSDYTCSQWIAGYDRGHLAPRATFKGIDEYWEVPNPVGSGTLHHTDVVTNIVPQNAKLNQGIWEELERAIREATEISPEDQNVLYVITGVFYERDMPPLVRRSDPVDYTVPSGFWKIVATGSSDDESSLKTIAFYFDQMPRSMLDPSATDRPDWGPTFRDHLISINEIESRAGYDFFPTLEDEFEDSIEKSLEGTITLIDLDEGFSDSNPSIQQRSCNARTEEQSQLFLIPSLIMEDMPIPPGQPPATLEKYKKPGALILLILIGGLIALLALITLLIRR